MVHSLLLFNLDGLTVLDYNVSQNSYEHANLKERRQRIKTIKVRIRAKKKKKEEKLTNAKNKFGWQSTFKLN